MLDFLLRCLAKSLLWLRYRVRTKGLDAVAARGTSGIFFFPNHPALIDPVILISLLHKKFRAGAIAEQDEIDRFFMRFLARRAGVMPMPGIARHGQKARDGILRTLSAAAERVRQGENLVLYPAGHLQHSAREDLRGNSGVETLLRAAPDARVVLVRTRGLWGSGFSWARGKPPSVKATLKKGIAGLLLSGLFFAPRRLVTIEFVEPEDFPRAGGREEINRYLERCYNAELPRNTFVPYTFWRGTRPVHPPEPQIARLRSGARAVPPATRQAVLDHLAALAGAAQVGDDAHLARDLGLDSLARADLLAWLEAEFGFPQGDADALNTVSDVILAACGETATSQLTEVKPVPKRHGDHTPIVRRSPFHIKTCPTQTPLKPARI